MAVVFLILFVLVNSHAVATNNRQYKHPDETPEVYIVDPFPAPALPVNSRVSR